MNKFLNNPKNNIIAIIIAEIIALSFSFTTVASGADSIANVLLKWVPAFIGITTLLLYFVSFLLTKKHNWIISLIGIVIMFITTYNLPFTN